MKRIKSANGYTIYQANTARDAETYGCEIGSYNIYLSSDIRDFGLTHSYPEWENEDSLAVAIARCNGSQYAVAVALADEISGSTAQDMDLVLEIERMLEQGDSIQTVRAVISPRYIDDEDLWCEFPENTDDDDELADDDLDPDQVIDDLAAGKLDDRPAVSEGTWYTSVALEGSLRQELISGIGSEDTHDEIESTGIWGMAVLEIGYADIEINITHDTDDRITAEYFVCLKEETGDWHGHGYIDRPVTIDWSAPNWKDLLHDEMRAELLDYAAGQDWDLRTPFPEELPVYGEYAAEQCPVDPEPETEPRSHATYYVTLTEEGEYHTHTVDWKDGMSPDMYRRYFFRTVAMHHAFSDCGYDSIEEIVFDGHRCSYAGWLPGMEMMYVNDITGRVVFDECFPEWDH